MYGGMQQLIKQFNQMQNKVKKVQEELSQKEFTGSSGGGAVNIKVNGDNLLTEVKLDEELIKSNDKEMLEDLILTATNDAIQNAKKASAQQMEQITGGVSIPGLF